MMRLEIVQALECRVCRQLILPDRQQQDRQDARLFGVIKYAACPCCSQRVPDPTDRNYRQRARRFRR